MPEVRILRPGFKRDRVGLPVGEVVEVSERDAKAMLTFHLAEKVKPETADAVTPEVATAPPVPETGEAPHSAKEIREWAAANDVDVPARGAIPADVREKFDAAHAAD